MAELKITIYKDNRRKGGKPYLVRWVGEYSPQTGKQTKYCRSFSKRKDAELFAQQKKDEFDYGMPRDEISITLQQLTDKFIKAHQKDYKNGTMNNYLYTIKRLKAFFSPNTLINNIKQEHCEQFISSLGYIRKNLVNSEKELSDSYKNIQLRNCKRIFNKALEWKYIRINPFDKIKQVKAVTRPWHRITVDEFHSILEKTPTLRKKVFYAVQFGCGLRMGEAINLLIDGQNLDFQNHQIHLFNRPATIELPPFTLKDFESRSIRTPDFVVNLLLQLYNEVDEGSPFLFLTRERWEKVKKRWDNMRKEKRSREWDNRNLCNNLLREFKRQCKNAGVKTNDRLTLHCLRKSWACSLAENGVPPQTLLKMGGWSDIETVQKFYLKSSDENERRAVEVLDRLMGSRAVEKV
jgi:integrase